MAAMTEVKVVGTPESGVPVLEMKGNQLAIVVSCDPMNTWGVGTIIYCPVINSDTIMSFKHGTWANRNSYPTMRVRILEKGDKVEITI